MQRYDYYSKCPKCGMTNADSRYHVDRVGELRLEQITRTCKRCGYTWDEGCLDDARFIEIPKKPG